MKKIISFVVLVALSLSLISISNAFQYMDVCNYTNGDHSGDYYDGICTKDGKPEEWMHYSFNRNNLRIVIDKQENHKHKLNPVPHNTGSAYQAVPNNRNNIIIRDLQKKLAQKDLLLEEVANKNNELLKNLRQKEILINKLLKENIFLKNKIKALSNQDVKERIIIIEKKADETYDIKTAAENIREKIKKRNESLRRQ